MCSAVEWHGNNGRANDRVTDRRVVRVEGSRGVRLQASGFRQAPLGCRPRTEPEPAEGDGQRAVTGPDYMHHVSLIRSFRPTCRVRRLDQHPPNHNHP